MNNQNNFPNGYSSYNNYPQNNNQYNNPHNPSRSQPNQNNMNQNPYSMYQNQYTGLPSPVPPLQFNPAQGIQNQSHPQFNQQYPQQNPANINSYPNPHSSLPPFNYQTYSRGTMNQFGDTQNLIKNLIFQFSDSIFMKYDLNRSGYLDVREIFPAVSELFQICHLPQPNYQDVINLMRTFDTDQNGLIDIAEFRRLMLIMNGIN